MASERVNKPLLHIFHRYVRWYLKRNFRSVRVAGGSPEIPAGMPILVCLNHPSWWDPLLSLAVAMEDFPDRTHYAPIDAAALQRYKFFGRIGFFGVERGTRRGALSFTRSGTRILQSCDSVLWVTAQGAFVDPRVRPVELRGGIGHLIRQVGTVAVLPLALEYTFWEERYPEALAMWGAPILITQGAETPASIWTSRIAAALESTQDRLAAASMERKQNAFKVLVSGSVGVGGVYDFLRRVASRFRGERFSASHGLEKLQ